MPGKQTRFAGPMCIGKVSKEEMDGLRTLVSIEKSKVIHVIFWATGGGSVTLCAKASEKLSLALWTRLLGVSMIQQTDIIPPSVMCGESRHKDVYSLGVVDCRRVTGYEEFTSDAEDTGGNGSENTGGDEDAVEIADAVASPPKGKKKAKKTKTTEANHSMSSKPTGKRNRVESIAIPEVESEAQAPAGNDMQTPPAKKQRLPYWVYPHLEVDPEWEPKIKSHLAIRMKNTKTAKDGAKTPLDQLPVEQVWNELYAESLVWCKDQMPKVVQPGLYHKEYVAQGMSMHPLATEEWRQFARDTVPTLWNV